MSNNLDKLLQDYRHAARTVKQERQNLLHLRDKLTDSLEAQKILQSVAKAVQQKVHERISRLVSDCLKTCFPYRFEILFEEKRGKTEARMVFFDEEENEIDPLTAAAGGAVDLASFALRLTCLILQRPKKRRLLILDEPFKHLSKDRHELVGRLIEKLSEELGVQVVMVTHSEAMRCGLVHELSGE
jgi:DNA repair exonuclease SbcCD ATPase subunit